MATQISTRLDPSIFRLPVDRIRQGYYSDQYFVYTKALLEAEDHHPRVLMQVFQKKESVLGGIDEAIAVLKLCSGHEGEDGVWIIGLGRPRGPRAREGDQIAPRETVMTIEGDYSLFAHLETVYLGSLARRSLIMRNVLRGRRSGSRQANLLLPGPSRPLAGPDRRRLERARRRRDRRVDRRAGVLVGRAWDRHRPARADRRLRGRHGQGGPGVRRPLPPRDERHRAGRLGERFGADRARGRRRRSGRSCGACAWTPARTSSTARCSRRWAGSSRSGSIPGWSRTSAARSTSAGYPDVRIVASGGFTAERIREFEAAGIPVDAYGVGSSLIRGDNDFTADVVCVDGRPCAKVGRRYSPNPRLERVE